MISIKYCCNFLRNYFFLQSERQHDECMNFQVLSFLTFFFASIKTICTLHSTFSLFIAGFQNFQFFFLELKMRSLSQCFFVCIKWIETVMIRSANSQIAKLLFLLSISFQLLTNGIDQKSLLIFWFLSSQWLKIRENGLI